jgi:hypothetical protein
VISLEVFFILMTGSEVEVLFGFFIGGFCVNFDVEIFVPGFIFGGVELVSRRAVVSLSPDVVDAVFCPASLL